MFILSFSKKKLNIKSKNYFFFNLNLSLQDKIKQKITTFKKTFINKKINNFLLSVLTFHQKLQKIKKNHQTPLWTQLSKLCNILSHLQLHPRALVSSFQFVRFPIKNKFLMPNWKKIVISNYINSLLT